ncbi:uncharacterized protein I206_104846 [Kwoniella pini CBS 10737]|uniref:Uncharacterized protein n=1 Tax=Kwoniella pini CBS 10737 TaxID=1296096 RepID=A0A1B9I8B5_9TREE|nr:uncharacterized protein I206_02386 [Kwoniella pini CBS 10737]OCF51671.1 hypothetical protein I206_02386 [Kwoniella pini CBS 10737]
MFTLVLPVIGSKPLSIPLNTEISYQSLELSSNKSSSSSLHEFATRNQGEGGIGIGAIIGIIISILSIILLILFLIIKNKRKFYSNDLIYNTSSPPRYNIKATNKSYFPSQMNHPILPRYNGNLNSIIQQSNYNQNQNQNNQIQFPSTVYNSGGYYSKQNKVRFGGVGIRHY